VSHRKPPLSPARPGWCRWCDEPIEPRLKKNGKAHARQTTMHKGCADEYWMAQNVSRFKPQLIERDGAACVDCGPDGAFLEVDHEVPLWKVTDLPPAQRRKYFLLGNLRLLCFDCHNRKSAKEAAERAHHKRLVKPKKRRGAKLQSRPFDTRLRRKIDGTVEVRRRIEGMT
jgi:hypothetical protein